MQDVFKLQPSTTIDPDESYIRSYRAIRTWFGSIGKFDPDMFIVAAHVVYGWMPTILELAVDTAEELASTAAVLNRAKSNSVSDDDLKLLTRVVNNSLVGASKLLHFTSPEHYAIWDSRVYRFVFERPPHHYRMNDVQGYRDYHAELARIQNDQRFPNFHVTVNDKLGYCVSPLRAIELVMYNNAR